MFERSLIYLQLMAQSWLRFFLAHPIICLFGAAFFVNGSFLAAVALFRASQAPIAALVSAVAGCYMAFTGFLLLRRNQLSKQLIPHFFLVLGIAKLFLPTSGPGIASAVITILFAFVVFILLSNEASQKYFEGH